MLRWLVLGVALLTGCGASTPPPIFTDADGDRVYVGLRASAWTASDAARVGFSEDHPRLPGWRLGWLPRRSLAELDAGLYQQVAPAAVARGWIDPVTLEEALPEDVTTVADALAAQAAYLDHGELTAELHRLAADYPERVAVFSAGQSVQGRDLWTVRIAADVAQPQDRPKVLLVANMHGDETVGREVMVELARLLAQDQGSPRITPLLEYAEVFIMPTMNPDGFAASRFAQRSNAHGVDLNRDFPDFVTDPRDEQLGREPETQAIMRLHAEHHFVAGPNFHGGALCFNMPWDTVPNTTAQAKPFGDDRLMRLRARDYAAANPPMAASRAFAGGVTYGYEWYPVHGGFQDWANAYRRSFHATVELSDIKYPVATALDRYWQDNRNALLGFIEGALKGYHLEVVDPQGQPLTDVTVETSDATRTLTYQTARVHRLASPAARWVRVSADGYAASQIDAPPEAFRGVYERVVLRPSTR